MRFVPLSLFAITALVLNSPAFAQVEPPAMAWEVLPEKSSIEWTAIYNGKPVTGAFPSFSSDIHFDPEKLGSSSVEVKIDTSKISSDDKDAEQSLPGGEWFNASVIPYAVFEAKTFTHVSDEQYKAEGTLRIGEKQNPVVLPFSVHFYQDTESATPVHYAQMTAETAIKRSDYGLGKGDWSKTDIVLDDVKVTINIKAKEAPQPKPEKP